MSGYQLEVDAGLHAALQQIAHDALRFAGADLSQQGLQGLDTHTRRVAAVQQVLRSISEAAKPKPSTVKGLVE